MDYDLKKQAVNWIVVVKGAGDRVYMWPVMEIDSIMFSEREESDLSATFDLIKKYRS